VNTFERIPATRHCLDSLSPRRMKAGSASSVCAMLALASGGATAQDDLLYEYPPGFLNDTSTVPLLNLGAPFGGVDFPQSPRNEASSPANLPAGQTWEVTNVRYLTSLVCSQGVLLSLRFYESEATSRTPGSRIFEQLESSCYDDDDIVTLGGTQYRIIRQHICTAGNSVVMHNPGPGDKRIWMTYWGEECLTQATWGVCHPQIETEPPTAFRCEVPTSCPIGQSSNVWTDYTSQSKYALPNCPIIFQIRGQRVDIFYDGFESGAAAN
jgi:hypothetical protein